MATSRKNKKKIQDIVIGKKYTLRSKTLKEERAYWMYLPASYKNNTSTRYPVLYLLDGEHHFHSVSGMIDFMSTGYNGNHQIPELIVVGIPNTDRTRDLTPTHNMIGITGEEESFLETSGGGDNFLKFINDELFPKIESKFRTLPYRILVGHSFGGLLALHTLINKKEMFNAYISIDPSLFWDNDILTRNLKKKVGSIKRSRTSAFISLANTPDIIPGASKKFKAATRKFTTLLQQARSSSFRFGYKYYDDETHGSVPFISLYHGLLHTFDGFNRYIFNSISEINSHFKKISKTLGIDLVPDEGRLNNLGYVLLFQNDIKGALGVFKHYVASYPKSANAYDSLGEAYMIKGDKAQAIKNYKKSLKLDPKNTNAKEMLKRLGKG